MNKIIGRKAQLAEIRSIMKSDKAAFVAITGRRRIGKTFLVEQAFGSRICFNMSGIQDGSMQVQLNNFIHKIREVFNPNPTILPKNWQQAFNLFKECLKKLPKSRKQVIFFDELPWMCTHKSSFIQLFAHLWNDYLSKEKHFILVICGSATSWIYKNIQNDKGGFHNRITHQIHLEAFSLSDTRDFLHAKGINLVYNDIAELYMILGGVPFYLDKVQKGQSVSQIVDRLFFSKGAPLQKEYDNLYKALFENAANHEAVIKALASSHHALLRDEIIIKSGVSSGGPINRCLDDLISCDFVVEEAPFGKVKRGSLYRLNDEYSYFYHKFIKGNKIKGHGSWVKFARTQPYKIWTGFAFESLCKKHMDFIKQAMGIAGLYSQSASFSFRGNEDHKGFQIDILLDRDDNVINLFECKYYNSPLKVDKKFATDLTNRRALFVSISATRKTVFNTLITNVPIIENQYALAVVDSKITLKDLFGT